MEGFGDSLVEAFIQMSLHSESCRLVTVLVFTTDHNESNVAADGCNQSDQRYLRK